MSPADVEAKLPDGWQCFWAFDDTGYFYVAEFNGLEIRARVAKVQELIRAVLAYHAASAED